MKTTITTLALILASPLVFAKGLPEESKKEIQHLFNYLKASNCQFNRNGDWFEAGKAADHLNAKYSYLLKKSLLASTEDFIDLAATKSSLSGKAYQVKCAGGKPEDSATWFRTELALLRLGDKK